MAVRCVYLGFWLPRLDQDALAAVLGSEGQWAIPGGPGAFLTTLRRTDDGEPDLVAITAETWVSADQLYPAQEAQVAAIRFRQDGPTLGDGLLQPHGPLAAGWASLGLGSVIHCATSNA